MTNRWYKIVSSAPAGDYTQLAAAMEWYDEEYKRADGDLVMEGRVLADVQKRLPGLMSYYYGHLQDIDAIHQWLEIIYARTIHKVRKGYLEHYARQLSDRVAQQYAETDEEVLTIRMLINEVSYRSRNFTGITKGLEFAHYQLSNLTKLVVAGIEDTTI